MLIFKSGRLNEQKWEKKTPMETTHCHRCTVEPLFGVVVIKQWVNHLRNLFFQGEFYSPEKHSLLISLGHLKVQQTRPDKTKNNKNKSSISSIKISISYFEPYFFI